MYNKCDENWTLTVNFSEGKIFILWKRLEDFCLNNVNTKLFIISDEFIDKEELLPNYILWPEFILAHSHV